MPEVPKAPKNKGGRPKGAKSKRTMMREVQQYRQTVRKLAPVAAEPWLNGIEFVGESLARLGEAMEFFTTLARREKNEDKKREFYKDVVAVAAELAPYRYPKYATLKIGTDGANSVLVDDGVSAADLIAGVLEFMDENGIPKSKLVDVTPSGVANR
jgi:hypothetical protein